MENFCSFILRVSTLQILQTTGFEKSSSIGADVLTDVFGKYLELLGTIAQKNATHAGRTRANAYDVGATFEKLGIKFNELEEWLQNEKDSKAYGSWEGEDPSEVLKDLLGGSPQGSTDDQYLVFGESSSRVNLDDEFHLFGEVTEEDSEEERHTKRKRQYGFSVSNYHSKNELGKKESHLNQFQDFPLDETASLQNSDLAEDKINNQVWWGQFMPSYVPEHLPPFPDLYFRQKLKDEQITPSSQLIEDNQKTNNGVLDLFRALDLKEHKADEVKDIFDENVQLGLPNIQDSDDREDNLLIQKNSPRTTSDTLKLPSSESFENAFKSFAPKKFPISITDKPKKRRRVGKSPFVIPIVETVSSTSQHPLYSESWTESIPESVPKELHLPKIEVTKPTSTLNPDTQPEELIDVVGDNVHLSNHLSNDNGSVKLGSISLKGSQDDTNASFSPILSSSLPITSQLQNQHLATAISPVVLRNKQRNSIPSTPRASSKPISAPSHRSKQPSLPAPSQVFPARSPHPQAEIRVEAPRTSRKNSSKSKKPSKSKVTDVLLPVPSSSSSTSGSSSSKSSKIKLRLSAPSKTVPAPVPSQSPTSLPLQFHVPAFPPVSTLQTPDEEINCICEFPNVDNNKFMIACDTCSTWFHGGCVGLGDEMQVVSDAWHCVRCKAAGR